MFDIIFGAIIVAIGITISIVSVSKHKLREPVREIEKLTPLQAAILCVGLEGLLSLYSFMSFLLRKTFTLYLWDTLIISI